LLALAALALAALALAGVVGCGGWTGRLAGAAALAPSGRVAETAGAGGSSAPGVA
jgi:hypothetical protein